MDKISVIIPVINGSPHLNECLNSIFKSTYKNLEVIILNDGSVENIDAEIEDYEKYITILKSDTSELPQARNFGLQNSSGEFVSFFDADDINSKMRFELSVAKMAENPKVGMVFCGTTFINELGEFQPGISKFPGFGPKNFLGHMFERNWISTISTTIFKSSLLESLNGFDEKFQIGSEYDLYLRSGKNSQVEYLNLPLVRYRISSYTGYESLEAINSYIVKALQKHDPSEIASYLSERFKSEAEFRDVFGKILYKIGLVQEALMQFKRSLELNNDHSDIHFHIGNCHLLLEDYKDATASFRECLRQEPNHQSCINNLGIIYRMSGKIDQSVSEFKKAVEIGDNVREPEHNLSCVMNAEPVSNLRIALRDMVWIPEAPPRIYTPSGVATSVSA